MHLAPGIPWLASAAALGLLSRRVQPSQRGWLEAPAILSLVVSVSPHFGLWPGFVGLPLLCAGALALTASIHAVRFGRSWQGLMLATLCVFSALLSLEHGTELLIPMAAVVLLATPALLASITVPLAALLLGVAFLNVPAVLLGISVATALLALLEENDLAWRTVLNRASLTWAATITSALALLTATLLGEATLPMLIPAVLLPLVWARATRRGELLAAGIAFTALAGPWWCAPLLAIAAGRLLQLGAVRRALGLASNAAAALEQRRALEGMVLFGVAALVGASAVAMDAGHARALVRRAAVDGRPVPRAARGGRLGPRGALRAHACGRGGGAGRAGRRRPPHAHAAQAPPGGPLRCATWSGWRCCWRWPARPRSPSPASRPAT